MRPLPDKFKWLANEKGPKILVEALRHYGILEHTGDKVSPDLNAWCREMKVNGWFPGNDFPWCGLFMSICVSREGYDPPKDFLGARNWLKFGKVVPKELASLGDILVFSRPGGNHVGLYVGENVSNYLVYGGNQSNAVGFAFIDKNRCIGVRRCIWKAGQPSNVRKIYLSYDGQRSNNEQ